MPLNVRLFGAVVLLVLISVFGVLAQSPTSADIARERVKKAKAFVAVKNYNAAIYELEGIRREINDPTVHSVVNVMLMNCYLEQGDYKRAQTLLNELYNAQKANKPNAAQNYFAVAAQVVKSARYQAERYKALGLMVNDRSLPADAVADIDKMRETVETVITQSKTITADKNKSSDAFAIIEESSNARVALARDDYDAKRWKEVVADARENLMTSRSTVLNAVDDGGELPTNTTVASNTTPGYTNAPPTVPTVKNETQPNLIQISDQTQPKAEAKTENPIPNVAKNEVKFEPVQEQKTTVIPEKTIAENQKPKETPKETVTEKQTTLPNVNNENTSMVPTRERLVNPQTATTPNGETGAQNNSAQPSTIGSSVVESPLQVGSLLEYATQKVNPIYPLPAKSIRMTGVVRVEVVINEDGSVSKVQNTSGPAMLQQAAVDALRKWKFKPFIRDGQPVKATGFVNFNFNL